MERRRLEEARRLVEAGLDPFIRNKFEAELAKRGLSSAMPEEAYKDPNYQWSYS